MIMTWNREMKEEVIRMLAFVIWQQRSRIGEHDANDERKNWLIAKDRYYHEEMTEEELEYIG